MEKTVLKADLRQDKPSVIRRKGYVPGVLHGPGTLSTSVQFKGTDLIRAFAKHGSNAKIYVKLNNKSSYAIVKEVQYDPVDRQIVHVMIHLVSQDQEIKMTVPIAYIGREELENRLLTLQIVKPEIDLTGRAAAMPEAITVDVTGKQIDDAITSEELGLAGELTILDAEDELYAIVKEMPHITEETETVSEDSDSVEPPLVNEENSEDQ